MAQRLGVRATAKRIDILRRHITPSKLFLRHCKSDATVTIGDVSVKVSHSENACFVPHKYVLAEFPQSVLRHLKWMAQKDALCQDMFLIGPPGPLRRALAFMYLELTNRESEYIALSRDTTESDLKQRREIKDGTAFYIDQCAVRAAVSGRVLVLDGIEKAERNVLPILNNLLENREMQLEDGRFLMRADTYDKLLTSHSKDVLNSWRLVRVSENFRVIALGLPVPRYIGNPLDPPLRSRFQSRDVGSLPFKDLMHLLLLEGPRAPEVKLTELVSFAMALNQPDAQNLGLPDFPINSLTHAARILSACPAVSPSQLVTLLYPHALVLKSEAQAAVDDMRKKFELGSSAEGASAKRLSPEVQIVRTSSHSAHLTIKENSSESATIEVSVGDKDLNGSRYTYIPTPHHDSVLVEMLHSHVTSDFCIVGTKGCGKTALVNKFADLLGYHVEPIMLYQDMTSRDLLQQRTTLPNGDTVWRHSPLVTAALMGHLAVLDGVHRLHPGALSVLSRLVHDRELNLMDGSRLLRADRFEEIQRKTGLNEGELNERAVFKIHPAFRIVAVAEPPVLGGAGGTGQWLTPEMLTMFLFHSMKPLSIKEEEHVLSQLAPNTPATSLAALLKLTDQLRTSHDAMCRSLAASLSTRQLLRIARRMSQYPEDSLREAVNRACLSRFLPHLPKMALDQIMDDLQIKSDPQASPDDIPTSIEVKDGFLRIGRTAAPVYIGSKAEGLAKIPDILFYENVQHSAALETMLKDYAVGEHLLLIGNQGVGKNKLADRFLQLLGRPREYVQLHRDTTVQTLTLQPTVRDGAIVYDDSPLVKAVRDGLVLVIDEADKAPTNVTCILKTLVESGQMLLADGRKIVSDPADVAAAGAASRIIPMHPDFRMIVLANRPGFPFLGNDFFSSMGDAFACHAIDNPDVRSEIAMLQRYAPDVPEATLRRLVLAFGELRTLADQGLIAYPYSTREVVAVAKHLQKYPSDGLTTSVRNVFDFDSYNKEMRDMVIDTLHKHGIPIGVAATNVQLARE